MRCRANSVAESGNGLSTLDSNFHVKKLPNKPVAVVEFDLDRAFDRRVTNVAAIVVLNDVGEDAVLILHRIDRIAKLIEIKITIKKHILLHYCHSLLLYILILPVTTSTAPIP